MATFGVEGITPDCEVCRRIVEVLITGNLSPSIKNLAVGNLKRHGESHRYWPDGSLVIRIG